MKTTRNQLLAIGYAITLLFAGTHQVSAFYNPSAGRWLNRDPIQETAFENAFQSTESPPDAAGLALFLPAFIDRTFGENLYAFLRNEPVSSVDYLGLLKGSQQTRTIPDCAIEIYAGHGYLDKAFNEDGTLKNSSALDRLKYPHILKGTKCSAGGIIACNAARFATVNNPIPGVSLDDTEITKARGLNAIDSAFANAKLHALTMCMDCPSCQEITITVNCFPPFSKPGIFTSGNSLCGTSIKVPCLCNKKEPEK